MPSTDRDRYPSRTGCELNGGGKSWSPIQEHPEERGPPRKAAPLGSRVPDLKVETTALGLSVALPDGNQEDPDHCSVLEVPVDGVVAHNGLCGGGNLDARTPSTAVDGVVAYQAHPREIMIPTTDKPNVVMVCDLTRVESGVGDFVPQDVYILIEHPHPPPKTTVIQRVAGDGRLQNILYEEAHQAGVLNGVSGDGEPWGGQTGNLNGAGCGSS